MNIRELDELNIKAMLCDILLEKENIEKNIDILKAELERRENDRKVKVQSGPGGK
ncbi:MAG: hypothetical protein P8P37_02430 [Candidatus Marinimicrobia bacterium]|nr:hypothetical protein [Candidatus Neomarinimicrobiota bacterium]